MYYGCITRSNRARWLATVILLFVAVALAIVYALEVQSCQGCEMRQGQQQCQPMSEKITPDGMKDVRGCRLGFLWATFMGFIVFGLMALIPCCAMGCCVDTPEFDSLDQEESMVTQELPISARAPPSFARAKSFNGQPHCAPPSGHSSLCFSPSGPHSREVDRSIRGAAAAAAAIAAARAGPADAVAADRAAAAAAAKLPQSGGTAISAASRGSLLIDGSGDSWAMRLLPEGVRRSSPLKVDSYSTNASMLEVSTPSGPGVDVPVIIDFGPIAATAADVEASVNGNKGHKVACSSARAFESRKILEELSSMLSSVASSAHSQSLMSGSGAVHAAAGTPNSTHQSMPHSMDSAPLSGGGVVQMNASASSFVHDDSIALPIQMQQALSALSQAHSTHGVPQQNHTEIEVADAPSEPSSVRSDYASRYPRLSGVAAAMGVVGPHGSIESVLSGATGTNSAPGSGDDCVQRSSDAFSTQQFSSEQVILDQGQTFPQPPQRPHSATAQHPYNTGPFAPHTKVPSFTLQEAGASMGGAGGAYRGLVGTGVHSGGRSVATEGVYGYPSIMPQSLVKLQSTGSHSTVSGKAIGAPAHSSALRTGDSSLHTDSTVSSASISYWAHHAAAAAQHPAQHATQLPSPRQNAHVTPNRPPARPLHNPPQQNTAASMPSSHYHRAPVPGVTHAYENTAKYAVLQPRSTGSIPAAAISGSFDMHAVSPGLPRPNSSSSNIRSQPFPPLNQPPVHASAYQMHAPAVQCGQLQPTRNHGSMNSLDSRMDGMQSSTRYRANALYSQFSGPRSAGSVSSTAQNWYNPPPAPTSLPRSRRSAAKHAHVMYSQPGSGSSAPPMHHNHALHSIPGNRSNHNAPMLNHDEVVNQQPTATLATVGPPQPQLNSPSDYSATGHMHESISPHSTCNHSGGDQAPPVPTPHRNSRSGAGHPTHHYPGSMQSNNAIHLPPNQSHYSRRTPFGGGTAGGSSQTFSNNISELHAGPRSFSHHSPTSNTPEEGRGKGAIHGTRVSAAWARVAGGSGSLNAWYQTNRLPRSADASTCSDGNWGNSSEQLDEKWVTFARQEVAELRLPSLQPQATFLL